MSKLPFDPMRTAQPPPPHIDTVGVDPKDYITVAAAGGHTFMAHRDCLCMAQLIRRAFAQRAEVYLEDVVVSFTSGLSEPGGDGLEDSEDFSPEKDVSSPAPTDLGTGLKQQSSEVDGNEVSATKAADRAKQAEDEPQQAAPRHRSSMTVDSLERNKRGVGVTFTESAFSVEDTETHSTRSDCTASSPERDAPAEQKVVYRAKDNLRNNRSVTISFPRSSHEIVDTVLGYLYYKHRYDRGNVAIDWPPRMSVPPRLAIAVMKLASILEC